MPTISFTLTTANLTKVKDAMKGLYDIPQISDPNWVDPEDGTEAPMVNEFTDSAWAKEATRRFVKRTVARWEQKSAKDAIEYQEDNNLLT